MAILTEEQRAQGRAVSAKNRAERKAAAASGPSLADVMAAITNLVTRVESVEKRSSQQSSAQFVPMRPAEGPLRPVTFGQATAGLDGKGNDSRTGGDVIEFLTATGQPAGTYPLYSVGQRVRLRPDVHHGTRVAKRVRLKEEDGTPAVDKDGKPIFTREITLVSWGQVLAKSLPFKCVVKIGRDKVCGGVFRPNEPCSRCGAGPEVAKVFWVTKDGGWKYKVRVPGLSQSSNIGQDVLEHEIEAVG